MNKVILFLFPFAFKYNDYEKFELNLLENSADIYVCELLDYLHKSFSNTYPNRLKKKNILKLKNKKQINKFFNEIINKYNIENIYVINHVDNINIKSLLFNIYMRKKFKHVIKMKNAGIRTYNYLNKKSDFFNILKDIVKKNKKVIYFNFKVKIIKIIFDLASNNENIDYVLAAGKYFKKESNLISNKNKYFIDFNSWDYSRTLTYKTINYPDLKNSIVFLDIPNPKYLGEQNLYGIKNTVVADEWFTQLTQLFHFLASKLKKKIIICPHPLTPADDYYKKQFSNFRIIENETMQTIFNSDLVITVGSTALSYALIYKKPLLFVHNNSLKQWNSFISFKKFSEELNCKILNISNEKYKKLDYADIFKFDKDKYNSFINNYISFNFQKKSNSEIISNLMNKYEY